MKTMKTDKLQKTQEKTGFAQVSIKTETETNEERQARWLAVAIETNRQWQLKQDAKPKKVAVPQTPDTVNMTIQQEDYWYRKEMREAMEDDDVDMFSYKW